MIESNEAGHARLGAALVQLAAGIVAVAEALAPHEQAAGQLTLPAVDAAPAPLAYGSGRRLSGSSLMKRRRALDRSRARGYALAHWAGMVHRLRVEELAATAEQFGRSLGVSEGCIRNWESGVAFATTDNRGRLERLGTVVAGWDAGTWHNGAAAP